MGPAAGGSESNAGDSGMELSDSDTDSSVEDGAGNAAVDQMLENSELALNSKIKYEFAGGIRKAPSVIHLHHS